MGQVNFVDQFFGDRVPLREMEAALCMVSGRWKIASDRGGRRIITWGLACSRG